MSSRVTTGINTAKGAPSNAWGLGSNGKPSVGLTVANRQGYSFADGTTDTSKPLADFLEKTVRDYSEALADSTLRFERVILNGIHAVEDNWPLVRALKITPSDQLHVQWRKWIFNPQRLRPVPERGVSEQLGSTTQIRSQSLARFGLSFSQELQFASTEQGGRELESYLMMVGASMNETYGYDAINELKEADRLRRETNPPREVPFQTIRQAVEDEVRCYGAFVKTDRGMEDLVDEVKATMKNRGIKPDLLIIAGGAKHTLAIRPNATTYSQSGSKAEEIAAKGSDGYPNHNGVDIVESRQYIVGSNETDDPMIEESTVGEYATLRDQGVGKFETDLLSTELYDEDNDSNFTVDVRTAFQYSRRFDREGALNHHHDRLVAFLNKADPNVFSHDLTLQAEYSDLAQRNQGSTCFDPFVTHTVDANNSIRYMVTELFGQAHSKALTRERLTRIANTAADALIESMPNVTDNMTATIRLLNELSAISFDYQNVIKTVSAALKNVQTVQPDISCNEVGGIIPDLTSDSAFAGCANYPMMKTISRLTSTPNARLNEYIVRCRDACAFIEAFVDNAMFCFPASEFLNADHCSPNFVVKSQYTAFVENCLVGNRPALWVRLNAGRGFGEPVAEADMLARFQNLASLSTALGSRTNSKDMVEASIAEVIQQWRALSVPVSTMDQVIGTLSKLSKSDKADIAERITIALNIFGSMTHYMQYIDFFARNIDFEKDDVTTLKFETKKQAISAPSGTAGWIRLPLTATAASLSKLAVSADNASAGTTVFISASHPNDLQQSRAADSVAEVVNELTKRTNVAIGVVQTAFARSFVKASAAPVSTGSGQLGNIGADQEADSIFGRSSYASYSREVSLPSANLMDSGNFQKLSPHSLNLDHGLMFNKFFTDNYDFLFTTMNKAVARIMGLLFITSKVRESAFHAMFNQNIVPFGDGLLIRDGITHSMGGAIAMVSGDQTGATFIHRTDVRAGYNPANGTSLVNVSLWAKPIVMTEENVQYVPNVTFHGYTGGNGSVFYGEDALRSHNDNTDDSTDSESNTNASIYSCWVVMDKTIKEHMLPKTGLYPQSITRRVNNYRKELLYIGALFYTMIWGWSRSNETRDSDGCSVLNGARRCPIVIQGMQVVANPANRGVSVVITNKGHLGMTYPGVKNVRMGKSSVINSQPYGNVKLQ